MTADLVARLRAAGVSVVMRNGVPTLRAPIAPPDDLIAEARANRDLVIAELSASRHLSSADPPLTGPGGSTRGLHEQFPAEDAVYALSRLEPGAAPVLRELSRCLAGEQAPSAEDDVKLSHHDRAMLAAIGEAWPGATISVRPVSPAPVSRPAGIPVQYPELPNATKAGDKRGSRDAG